MCPFRRWMLWLSIRLGGWSIAWAGANFVQSAGPPRHPRFFARKSEKMAWVGQCNTIRHRRSTRIASTQPPISTSCRVHFNPLQGQPDIDHPDSYFMIDAFKAHTYPKINGWTGSRLKKQKRVASSQFVIISYRLSELECTSWLWTSGPTIRCGEKQLHRRYREIPPSNDPNDDGGAIERHLAFNAGSEVRN